MHTQLKRIFRISPFVLALATLISIAAAPAVYADNNTILTLPNGNDEYVKLCQDLKKISDGDLYQTNCRISSTQAKQDKAVKAICDRGINRLQADCDAYDTAIAAASPSGSYSLGNTHGKYSCGDPATNQDISTAINFGCSHQGPAMLDLAFAVIRFLSNGAGLVLIGSLVWGGLQYTLSRGDPQSTAMAVNRLRSVVFALVIFLFAYAILNYLIPGQILNP
ncbi:MAG TPA: hypothetical protein VF401_03680 [Candidatus Saccharimonadales bacterium]